LNDEIVCPLVTSYTSELGLDPKLLEKLYLLRKWDIKDDNPIPFIWPSLLRTHIFNLNTEQEEQDKPFELRQYQLQIIHHLVRMPKFLVGDSVGLRKAQPLDAKILTPTGWMHMGDVQPGQRIIDPDTGSESIVEGVYPQGVKPIFKVETGDGASTECCGDHLWTVQTPYDRGGGKFRTLSTQQLMDKGLHRFPYKNKDWKVSNFMLPLTRPVQYPKAKQPIPPYVLGALLGDGGLTCSVKFSNIDHEIVERVRGLLPPSLELKKVKGADWIIKCESGGKSISALAASKGAHTRFHTLRGVVNPNCRFCSDPNTDTFQNEFIRNLTKLGLFGKGSPHKFIPDCYLHSTVEDRKELLRGLTDTDGTCSEEGTCLFSTSSLRLREDMIELVRSLGGIVSVSQRVPTYRYKRRLLKGRISYTLNIRLGFNPFHLSRKSSRWYIPNLSRSIRSITPVGEKPTQCIKTSSKRELYITDGHIVTHNTTDAIAAICWLKDRVPDLKALVVTTRSTAQPLDAKILTPQGWMKMGDSRVGDTLIDPDGGWSSVLGVYPQGEKEVFRVTTTDGEIAECCGDHLWEVQTPHLRRTGRFKVLSTNDMLRHGLRAYKGSDHYAYHLPITVPIEFESVGERKVPPYVLGALLGDGSLRHGAIFYSEDKEIPNRVSSALPPHFKWSEGQYAIIQPNRGNGENELISFLRSLGLFGEKSPDKFIPESYLRAPAKERIELLRGLMDTDGSPSMEGQCVFITSSIKLRDDMISLVRSLGGISSAQFPIPPRTVLKEGKVFIKANYEKYVVSVRTPFNPFHLSRKANRWHPPNMFRAIKNIEPVGMKLVQCISTSAKRSLYVTDGHIVTHNTWQWHDEIRRFSRLRPFVMKDKYRGEKSSEARYQQLRDFLTGKKKDILIGKYSSMVGTRKKIEGKFDEDGNPVKNAKEATSREILTFAKILKEHGQRVVLVFDEAHRFKTPGSQTRALVMYLARQCRWAWGLTGTAMKNSLVEFYAGISALGIRPFGTMWDFGEQFCIYHKQYVGGGINKRVLDGYQNVAEFKRGIRPFYLGRSQAQVKEPLPKLQTTYHPVDLDDKQSKLLLDEIPNGTFVLPPSLIKVRGEIMEVERDPNNTMTMLSVQQLVANHWGLLDRENEKDFYSPTLSPKEEAFLDLLDGDLKGEKVIVFSKFLRHIDRLDRLTKEKKFTDRQFLRITGNEDEKQRNVAKRLFQESPEHDLIVINAAGIEGLNLQQAAHMVCLDLPWSWGDLIQLVGRMVRSASPHTSCTLHILVAKGTIDEYTIDVLIGKKGIFEAILGESSSGGLLGSSENIDLDGGMEYESDEEFRLALLRKAHKRTASMKKFLEGENIMRADREGDDYRMVFEKKGEKAGNTRAGEEELE